MIPMALIGICLCGLWLSTFPSYPVFLLIYCLLAVFADMFYWPTMLKRSVFWAIQKNKAVCSASWKPAAAHGYDRGILRAWYFSALGSTAFGLRCAILFYAILPGIIGIIMFFLLDPDSKQPSAEEQESVSAHQKAWAGAIQALKNKKSGSSPLISSWYIAYTAVSRISSRSSRKPMPFQLPWSGYMASSISMV